MRSLPLLLLTLLAALLQGCAVVSVSSVSPKEYLAERRGDVLTTGRLSTTAQEVLRVVGIDDCRERPDACRQALARASGITEEQRLSALSELWLEAALATDKSPALQNQQASELDAWLEAARHAWAYLFFTERPPGERAFEDRQTQVRDYYNFAVEQTVTGLFNAGWRERAAAARAPGASALELGKWQVGSRVEGFNLTQGASLPQELVTASSLRFSGLRNIYRRDGFGAPLVAVLPPPASDDSIPYVEMRYPSITALLSFEGQTLQQVLRTRRVDIRLYDPYRTQQIDLGGLKAPLTANFTAGYGLWLARSGFATQALRTLFGMSDGIVQPQVQLMQPYDPNRGIVVMLHGLASSPEAWVNVANEVLGDETLRQHYQIWQVYYPTNAPLALNRYAIEQALAQTLARFDPEGSGRASRDMVLVGHSMGGVLARLLVSDSGQSMWRLLPQELQTRMASDPALQRELTTYVEFHPMPQVTRAIFIAGPHRGTPFAEKRLARHVSNLVTLPLAMLDQMSTLTRRLAGQARTDTGSESLRIPDSIDNLSDQDSFVQAAALLQVSPRVRYHSIVGRERPGDGLAQSSDGVVPYVSAHLEGSLSEKVITSWHSVQETPQAILEVRRILLEHLRTAGVGKATQASPPAHRATEPVDHD
ncbi:pimeloyl-ACP methyl ester carboxylesterase [Xanthomonas translucens]